MLISSRFSSLLDANVLYPAPLRDYLLRLASTDIYKPHWTDEIQEEWIRNLLANRNDLNRSTLERTKLAMNTAFPDANIINYEALIPGLTLPDASDRHVLAAAIKGKVNLIVTNNTNDFPASYLSTFEIEVQNADSFITNLIELDHVKAIAALDAQVKSLKNPLQTKASVLSILEKCGITNSVSKLK